MKFCTRGHRRKPGYGLLYRADNPRYAVYKSYQASGVRLPVVWLALADGLIISRHRQRARAEAACERHAKARCARAHLASRP